MKRASLTLLALFLVTLLPGLAFAQDKKAVKAIEDKNAKAMEQFDNLDYEQAKKILTSALLDIKKAKLDKHPVAARTHGNLGIVNETLGDPDEATLQFGAALEIDPDWTVPKAYRTASVTKLYNAAKAQVGGGGGEPEPSGEILSHQAVDEAPAGKSIKVTAGTGSDKVKKVVLYYRPEGAENFTTSPMTGDGTHWEGVIPASATKGTSVQYYILAKGQNDKVLAGSGADDSPHVVSLEGGTKPEDDENPIKNPPVTPPPGGKKSVYFNLGLGTAWGIPSGNAEVSGQKITHDAAYKIFLNEPFHLTPELGFYFSPHASLAVMARLGFPLGANTNPHATQAPSFWARFNYHFGNYDGLTMHGDVGVGVTRHIVVLGAAPGSPNPAFDGKKDVVVGGPMWIGGGIGYVKTMGTHFALAADFTLASVIPVTDEMFGAKTNYVLNFDFTVGARLTF